MANEIALLGTRLIHTYPYLVHFNGATREAIEKNAKPWMKPFLLAGDLKPNTDAVRVTRIWSPDAAEVARLVETFAIERTCGTPEQALDGANGAMVMDEDVASRTALVEKCLAARVPTFADKVFSLDAHVCRALLNRAQADGVPLRCWSQLHFEPGLERVRSAPGGGVAFFNMQIRPELIPFYSVHAAGTLLGAFASPPAAYRPLSDANCRMGLIELQDGTRVFTYVGADVPPQNRLYYCAGNQEIVLNTVDTGACFERATAELVRLYSNRESHMQIGPDEVRQVCWLTGCLARGGSDGRGVSFEP